MRKIMMIKSFSAILAVSLLLLTNLSARAGEMVFGNVQGKVLDSSGNFVKGAMVVVGEKERKEVFRTDQGYVTMQVGRKEGRTDLYGDFEIKNVVTGYQPIVIKVDNRTVIKDMVVVDRGMNEFNFTLPPQGKVSSNFFQSAVYGKAVDENTRLPIAGARMEMNGKSIETGADGSFTMEWVPPGYHFIYGVCEGYKDFVQRAEVRKGDNYFEIAMIPRKKQAILASRVVDQVSGAPLSGVAVKVDNREVYTSSEGAFQVMVEKGRHHVMEVSHNGYVTYSKYIFAEEDRSLPEISLRKEDGKNMYSQSAAQSGEAFSGSSTGGVLRSSAKPDSSSIAFSDYGCHGKGSASSPAPASDRDRESREGAEAAHRDTGRVAYRQGDAPCLSGPSGGFMLPDARTAEKGKTALSTRFLRFSSGSAKELTYAASLNYGAMDNMEIGVSSTRVEAESSGVKVSKDTDSSIFFKYRPWEFKGGQGMALGASMSGDVVSPFAAYAFPLSLGGTRSGDMNMTLRRNILKGTSYTDYGLGMRLYLNNTFDLIMEGVRESLQDSSIYNLGFRYNGDNALKLDLYASWLFDVKDANGLGAGLTWSF